MRTRELTGDVGGDRRTERGRLHSWEKKENNREQRHSSIKRGELVSLFGKRRKGEEVERKKEVGERG